MGRGVHTSLGSGRVIGVVGSLGACELDGRVVVSSFLRASLLRQSSFFFEAFFHSFIHSFICLLVLALGFWRTGGRGSLVSFFFFQKTNSVGLVLGSQEL
jgi:hypothetical protein